MFKGTTVKEHIMTNILYYGACWPTNIGNAFIDLGAMHLLQTCCPDASVFMASELPVWLFNYHKHGDNALNLAQYIDCDYVTVSGMNCCDEFIRNEGKVIRQLKEKNIKILFIGCGQLKYTESETRNFRDFLEEIQPELFVSRDSVTYNNFADIAKKSYDGIDCAFWLPQAYKSPRLIVEDYIIKNFDNSEPPLIETDKKIFITHHQITPEIPPHHLDDKDNLISDLPYDYLMLYANTKETHSDRVHACIATLAYGNKARLYSNTPRMYLFDKVGATEIKEKLVSLDEDRFNELKTAQIDFLQEFFQSKCC